MLKWEFFKPRDFFIIAVIALITRVVFIKACNALDGSALNSTGDGS